MTTAFVNAAAARDFAYNTWQMVFSTPLKRSDFLLGRFFGATIVSVIPILGVSFGILLARYMPWADADRFGPVIWSAHLNSLLVFAIPNTVFVAAVIFAVAALDAQHHYFVHCRARPARRLRGLGRVLERHPQ